MTSGASVASTAVVTGSRSGIGAAIARRLAHDGWSVIGVDLGVEASATLLTEQKIADLTSPAQIEALVATLPPARALIHAAGFMRTGSLRELDPADGEAMWAIHVRALVLLAKAMCASMPVGGRLIAIGSRTSAGAAGKSQYAACKAAVTALIRSWAIELAPRGITANVIAPAATATPMLTNRIWSTLMTNEKPGGHGERSVAVGTIDMAVWDAVAKIAGKPLFRLLAERSGRTANPRVFVYAAGGYYYPGKDDNALRAEMRSYVDRGYTVVKMKIGGESIATDARRIESVLAEIGKDAQLAVDANGRFDTETAIQYAKLLRQYPLFWYEEAGDPLDYHLQSVLAEFYPASMATGENLFSHQDARNLIRYGGMRPDRDWLHFDCALSYGLVEYLRTLEVLRAAGWSASRCIPHGGHQMSLNIEAGLGLGGNESYPDLFQPYGGFPDGVQVERGHIVMPELPGIGFEGKSDLIRVMRALAE